MLPNARPGHLDESCHGVLGAERVLHRPQEVVGLEYEQHLAVDFGEHVRYLRHVLLRVLLDLVRLKDVKLKCQANGRIDNPRCRYSTTP